MNTFNNLATQNIKTVATLGLVYPRMNRKDAAKLKPFVTAIKSAVTSADKHLVNSLIQYVDSNGGKRVDRIASLANTIERLGKLNAGVLDNPKLKAALIDIAWIAYAKLEIQGTDNAHYEETSIPADGRTGKVDPLNNPQWKAKLHLPDSKYPGSEWALLETADLFISKARRLTMAGPINAPYQTREMVGPRLPASVEPKWTGVRYTAEPMQGGHGSGLPFDPAALPMPSEDRLAAMLGGDYALVTAENLIKD